MGVRSEQASDSILLRLVPRGSVDGRPHVVIVGAGFGGLTAAKGLAKAAVEVTLIDRENHHLFQPLLYRSPASRSGREQGAEIKMSGLPDTSGERRVSVLAKRHKNPVP